MSDKPHIVIDFDGPIHNYDAGWSGPDSFGMPTKGAQKALARFARDGWNVSIAASRQLSVHLCHWLAYHGIPWHYCNGWTHGDVERAIQQKYQLG
jgi:hypothetical protein